MSNQQMNAWEDYIYMAKKKKCQNKEVSRALKKESIPFHTTTKDSIL